MFKAKDSVKGLFGQKPGAVKVDTSLLEGYNWGFDEMTETSIEEVIFNPSFNLKPMEEYTGLVSKVQRYQSVLENTKMYREKWTTYLKDEIVAELERMMELTRLEGTIITSDKIRHLEYVMLSLGSEESGISEIITDNLDKPLIKHNGSLIYQQLFNGKVQVMISFPYIEGFGEPRPPKLIAIYRPEEIKPPFLIRHMEDFIKEITAWEDYDDDDNHTTNKIGFQVQHLQQKGSAE